MFFLIQNYCRKLLANSYKNCDPVIDIYEVVNGNVTPPPPPPTSSPKVNEYRPSLVLCNTFTAEIKALYPHACLSICSVECHHGRPHLQRTIMKQ